MVRVLDKADALVISLSRRTMLAWKLVFLQAAKPYENSDGAPSLLRSQLMHIPPVPSCPRSLLDFV